MIYCYQKNRQINYSAKMWSPVSQFQSNDLPQALKNMKIASKLTSIVTILKNIALAGEHIFQVLG